MNGKKTHAHAKVSADRQPLENDECVVVFCECACPALNLLPEADGKQRFGGCGKLKDAVKHAVQCANCTCLSSICFRLGSIRKVS